MRTLGALAFVVLGVFALRGVRRAYLAFAAFGLAYFPARAGFRLEPHACDLALDAPLAAEAARNGAHVVLFAIFFVMTVAQFPRGRRVDVRTLAWAGAATLVMGALVELAQGVSGQGNCELRDLVPDAAGSAIAAATLALAKRFARGAAAHA